MADEATVTGTATATADGAGSGSDAGSGSTGIDLAAFGERVTALENAEREAAPADAGGATTGADDGTPGVEAKAPDAAGEKATAEPGGEFKPTERQVDMAKQLGMTDEEIAGLTQAQAGLVDRMATRQSQAMSQIGRIQQKLLATEKGGTAAQAAAPATGEDGQVAPVDGMFTEADLDTSDGLVTKLNQYAGMVRDLSAAVEELRTTKAGTDEQTMYDTVDKFFGGLDAAGFPQFGTGAAADLDAEGDEYKARDALCAKASEIRAGYALLHDGAELPLAGSLNEALLIVAAEQLKAQAERSVTEKIAKRSTQRIARPTQQNQRADNRTQDEREADAVREGAAKLGIAIRKA